MALGSTPLAASEDDSLRHAWHAALRRGIILGLVVSMHLGALLLLLGPALPYRTRSDARSHTDSPLQLRIRLAAKPPEPRRVPVRPTPIKPITRRAPVRTSLSVNAVESVPATTHVALPTVAGDYHSPLLGNGERAVMSPTIPPLPGSDASRVPGISLDDKPSLKVVVRKLAKASSCGYARMEMQHSRNQYITGQLMDRALEADGCGASTPHTPVDDTVDAISHRAIFGD